MRRFLKLKRFLKPQTGSGTVRNARAGFTPYHFSSRKSDKGFTITELLIVIFIITLLASVVLVLLGEAQKKGRNSARVTSVDEYTKALELIRTEDGAYPSTGGGGNYWCLGNYSDDFCWDQTVTENAAFNTKLDRYIKNPPGSEVLVGGSQSYEGYRYRAPGTGGVGYDIDYLLEGTDRNCLGGQAPVNPSAGGDSTYCTFFHK